MFTLGIDQAVNAGFLRRLAAAGGGLCELVESEDRLDAVMAKVHRRIGTPIATELALRAPGFALDRESIAPAKLPDVYAGAPVVVFGRYRGRAPEDAAIEIEGTSLGDPLRMSVSRTTGAAAASGPAAATWLAASWARAHLRDLEDRYAANPQPQLERQIVQVSTQFSVLSRFTAFLAVDRSQVVNPGGVARQIVQPVELPAGWPAAAPLERSVGPRSTRVQSLSAPGTATRTVMIGAGGSEHAVMMPELDPPAGTQIQPTVPRAVPPMAALSPGGSSRPSASLPAPVARRSARPASPAPDESAGGSDPGGVSVRAYLVQLASLARELADGAAHPAALRRVRQRLAQWIEDVRSVGGHEPLAIVVEGLLRRLSEALAAPKLLNAAVTAIAQELQVMSTAPTPPTSEPTPPATEPTPPSARSRWAFWK